MEKMEKDAKIKTKSKKEDKKTGKKEKSFQSEQERQEISQAIKQKTVRQKHLSKHQLAHMHPKTVMSHANKKRLQHLPDHQSLDLEDSDEMDEEESVKIQTKSKNGKKSRKLSKADGVVKNLFELEARENNETSDTEDDESGQESESDFEEASHHSESLLEDKRKNASKGTKRTREDDSKNGVKKRKKDENDDTEIIGKNLLNNDLDAVGSSKKKIFWLKNGDRFYGTLTEFQIENERQEGEIITKTKVKERDFQKITPVRYFLTEEIEVRACNATGLCRNSTSSYSTPQIIFIKHTKGNKSIDISLPFKMCQDLVEILNEFMEVNDEFESN